MPMTIERQRRAEAQVAAISRPLNGCLRAMIILTIIVALGCAGLYIATILIPQLQERSILQMNETLWAAKGSANYSFVFGLGGYDPRNGVIVDVQNGIAIAQSGHLPDWAAFAFPL